MGSGARTGSRDAVVGARDPIEDNARFFCRSRREAHHHGETGIKGPDRATEFENPTVLSPARWVFFGLPGLGDDDRAARTLTAYPQGQHLADDRQRHDTEAHPWQNSLRGRPCSHSSVTLSATLAGSVTLGVTPKTLTGSASSILASFGG